MLANASQVFMNSSQVNGVTWQTGFIVFTLLEISLGTWLNGFIIFVLFFNHHLLEIPANIVLLSLAISDFFSCGVVLPYHLYEIIHLRETLFHQTLLLFSMTVGMIGILLLTGERFLSIICPLRYNALVTLSRTRSALTTSWLLCFVHSAIYYIAGQYKIRGTRYLISFVNFVAVLAMFVLYGVIFRAAFRQIRMVHNRRTALRSTGFVVFRRTVKSAKICGSLVLFFALTYLPVCINAITYEMRKVPVSLFNKGTAWLLTSVYLNCSVNPLLYCAFSPNLRAFVCKTWRRIWSWTVREPFVCRPRSTRRVGNFQNNKQLSSTELTSAFSVWSVDKSE